jgi:ribonuclease R
LFGHEKFSPLVLKPMAQHLSETERNSADAERDSKDLKLFAYLSSNLKAPGPSLTRRW